MITIKSLREIERMRDAGRIAAGARSAARLALRPGVTTGEIDRVVREYILSQSAVPTFLGYGGFPGCACVSINDEVIHGIPGKRVIRDGDIVSIDVGATYKGYVGDCAGTFPVGNVSKEARELIRITRESFFEGIKFARPGYRLSDVSSAIQQHVEKNGCSVVRDYVGHGIGAEMHEDPQVPNYGRPGRGPKLVAGMTLAIEPMVNAGGYAVRVLGDEWTVVTADGSLSAHYENTILITDGEPEILTMADDI
ncbi:MAG: type I methionyl aminopeptidase [Oscillospiraceae bacterium]|nr:type I methionyl aminopeptidase [Oscillospiraceae bacterium]